MHCRGLLEGRALLPALLEVHIFVRTRVEISSLVRADAVTGITSRRWGVEPPRHRAVPHGVTIVYGVGRLNFDFHTDRHLARRELSGKAAFAAAHASFAFSMSSNNALADSYARCAAAFSAAAADGPSSFHHQCAVEFITSPQHLQPRADVQSPLEALARRYSIKRLRLAELC